MNPAQRIVNLLIKNTSLKKQELEQLLSIPPDPKLGDYAFPCFKLGKNPNEAATKLKDKIKTPNFLEKVTIVGPYLNFYLNKTQLAKETIETIKKQKHGFGKGKQKQTILVEYCGPNTNKPLHLGHIRNMALGNATCRLLEFQGNTLHPVNIINDRGIHICQSMLAYQKWGKNKQPNKKGDHFVGDYYVLFAQKAKKDLKLKEEAQQLLQKWEQKDPKTRVLWKKMNKWVLDGFKVTYKRFGISFDKEYFESVLYEKGKTVAKEGLKKGVFTKDETGSIIAPLEKLGLTNKVILRSDDTSVYITQDMYLAQKRYEDYSFNKLIYVVASEQRLHFKQLFTILKLLKRTFAKNLYHLSYGLVNLPTGRMKSREGTVVDADNFMDEIANLAQKEIEKRDKTIKEAELKKRAEIIALGAIKFFMLRTDPVKDMVFNPEESLSFEGETGPYVQYTHARACSILRKEPKTKLKVNYAKLKEKKEHSIINLLSQFPTKTTEIANSYKHHLLCRYLIDLAQAFNEFYHAHKVLSDDKELSTARLALVLVTKQVLENGLHLLGIEAPERM